MIEDAKEQPEPPGVEIAIMDGKIMYSMMEIGDLYKLQAYIGALIRWIASGNLVHIGTLDFTVTSDKPIDLEQDK